MRCIEAMGVEGSKLGNESGLQSLAGDVVSGTITENENRDIRKAVVVWFVEMEGDRFANFIFNIPPVVTKSFRKLESSFPNVFFVASLTKNCINDVPRGARKIVPNVPRFVGKVNRFGTVAVRDM